MPITWQNINAPSNEGAMRGLALAGQGISSAFDKMGAVLAERQAANQNVVNRADDSNVLAIKEAYSKAKTPEEVAAVQALMESRVAGLSNKGRTSVLGADEARNSAVQRLITADNNFKDTEGARVFNNAQDALKRPMLLDTTRREVARQPSEQDLLDNKVTQQVALQPINDATNLQVAKNSGQAADFAATLAPQLNANAQNRAMLEGKTLTVQQKQSQNTVEDQGLEALTAQTAAAYRDSQQAGRLKVGALATKRGFPVDAAGAPDITKMTIAQKTQLNADAGLAGLRSIGDLFEGDTKAMNSFTRGLTADGKYSPEAVARNVAKIQRAFNTSGAGGAIGNDAAKIARDQAMTDVIQKEQDARNWYAPGSPDATTAYESLATTVDGMFGDNEKEDLPHVQALISDIAANGIKTKDGTMVVPPKEVILGAVRSTYEGWNFRNKGRSEDIAKEIKKAISTAAVADLLAQSEQSKVWNRQRAVRELLAPQVK